MSIWQIQEAKAQFSELVKQAQSQGPQEITLHGRPTAVVVSRELYDQLARTDVSLVDFMRNSPLHGLDDLEFERDTSLTRNVVF
ncbi:conserved protein of unknown function [Sterolibacterium denitrificans]|uniref:Antitoxin n=1 Tax=Sterolibacterium denitrificans TaxID=157592 RepID=A0A7Z7MUF7_9PROT|nr:type II toxin-antitoxin system Phd/YefM family antitoxin [Sterolibacterium denitrificans]SMB22558.1 conserved protein of unknown function [Sterolibacterium denitrificans]